MKKKKQIKDQHSQWLNPYFIKEEHYLKKSILSLEFH